MEWLNNHANALNVVANFLILFVWLFYAQLLYFNFKRQRRPRLLINRGQERDIDALCLISNMSSEPIYITHVIAVLHTKAEELMWNVIEHETQNDVGTGAPLSESTRQGPLMPGAFFQIGIFRKIIERVANAHHMEVKEGYRTDGTQFLALEIRIVAIYGSEDSPIGAYRVFRLVNEGSGMAPESFDTNRLSKWWWGRRRLAKWIRNQPLG